MTSFALLDGGSLRIHPVKPTPCLVISLSHLGGSRRQVKSVLRAVWRPVTSENFDHFGLRSGNISVSCMKSPNFQTK
ncbi:hypothetical protein RSAG8_04188, partial [Rhizoctonia solani AG-8 WAC10335]